MSKKQKAQNFFQPAAERLRQSFKYINFKIQNN